MPTTSTGDTVYAEPADVEQYIQTQPENFGLDATGSQPTEWREFLESVQVLAKQRIDSYCERDFEEHTDATITRSSGDGTDKLIPIPAPVITLSEVRLDGTPLDANSYTLQSGYLARSRGPLRTVTGGINDQYEYGYDHARFDGFDVDRGAWPVGDDNVEIDLDYGYAQPPTDIPEAEIKLVDHTLVGMSQKREGMVVQAGDVSAQINLPITMTTEIRRMLDRHTSMEMFS